MTTLTNDQMVEIGGALSIDDINWRALFTDDCGRCLDAIEDAIEDFDGSHDSWFGVVKKVIKHTINVWQTCTPCVNRLLEK